MLHQLKNYILSGQVGLPLAHDIHLTDKSHSTRLQVLRAESMNMTTFWDIALCSLEVNQRFEGAYCLHHHPADRGTTSETSVYFNDTTWHYIPESCHFQIPFCHVIGMFHQHQQDLFTEP
jgi:hypothetical protein